MGRTGAVALSAIVGVFACGAAGCSSLGRYSPLRPLEHRVLFHPEPHAADEADGAGAGGEDVWFAAEDGTRLHGWFFGHPRPAGVALFMHGSGGNLSTYREYARALNERHGLALFVFDYRGYGRSEGAPTEAGILQDARAARRWLAGRSGVGERSIILIGLSLGGAVAIDLAAADGARALIVDRSFTSLPAVVAHHAPWTLPRANMTMRFDSLSKIARYHGPVLISHGDADTLIPFHHGRQLYEAAPGPKAFVRLPGVNHNDGLPEEYHFRLAAFLGSLRSETADRR